MDDDPVLRALGEDLARDDPDLAARLTGGPDPPVRPPGRGVLWVLLLGAVTAVAAPFVIGPAAFGVMALLVLVGCPLAVSHWLSSDPAGPDGVPPSGACDPEPDP